MEDEALKRRTDCVYFLASPLTCKKGTECEFRHSESARLNLRDCWYWMNGNCRNPHCSFRHPPLEGVTDSKPNSVNLPPSSNFPTSKSNVPCYFYFSTGCIKGDLCPFMHDTSSAQKLTKPAVETTTVHPLEIKASTESDTGPASVEMPLNPTEDTLEPRKQYQPKVVQQQAHTSNLVENSSSDASSVPACEETAAKFTDSPSPPEKYKNDSGHSSPDRSLEEDVRESVEPDDRWESSPGFDVLVNDGAELLAYQDDPEYLMVQERESEMHHNHLLQYDFEGAAGYDTLGYPDGDYLYNHNTYESYDHMETRRTPEYLEREHSIERFIEPATHPKRRSSHREREMDDIAYMDLHGHFRKRQRMEVNQVSRHSRNHRSRIRGSGKEQQTRHEMGPPLHTRLASKVETNMFGSSNGGAESIRNDRHRRGRSGHPQFDRHARSRRRESKSRRRREKHILASEVSQDFASKKAISSQIVATGCSVEEQKRRPRGSVNDSRSHMPRHSRAHQPEDFEGPKPLSELLKDKRSHPSASRDTNDHTSTSSKQEQLESFGSQNEKRASYTAYLGDNISNHHQAAGKQDGEYESDFVDDDDDEDSLQKKLARILSG